MTAEERLEALLREVGAFDVEALLREVVGRGEAITREVPGP